MVSIMHQSGVCQFACICPVCHSHCSMYYLTIAASLILKFIHQGAQLNLASIQFCLSVQRLIHCVFPAGQAYS